MVLAKNDNNTGRLRSASRNLGPHFARPKALELELGLGL